MEELSKLIKDIKKDKDKFNLLLDKMKPLINKYVRILYKDEEEDTYSELCCALWEAVCKISFYENDGEIMKYLTRALHNKFHELYRRSRKDHDINIFSIDSSPLDFDSNKDNFNDILLKESLQGFLDRFSGTKKNIFYHILIYNLTDTEVSQKLNLSRQYVNRMRRILRTLLYDYFES